jgi:alanine racemase
LAELRHAAVKNRPLVPLAKVTVPRPIEALIHPDAVAHNLARARASVPDAKLWAVVKANAYGHGIERVYEGLRGADGIALLDLAEAERVRALGWRGPVLLLEGVFEPRDLELCSRLNLWHAVHNETQIDWLAAHKTHQPHRVFRDLADDALLRRRWTARRGAPGGGVRRGHARPAR